MINPPPPDAEFEPAEYQPDEAPVRRRRGRLLTPVRVCLTIALIASIGVVAYGLLARDATQIPVLTAGTYIIGVVFALLALAGAWAAYRRGQAGQSGRALIYAVLGGAAALLAAGSLASAIILTLSARAA